MSGKKTPKHWASTASFHGEYWVKCPHCYKLFHIREKNTFYIEEEYGELTPAG